MATKIEIKEEVETSDTDDKMEVLRLLKSNAPSNQPPQENPVDLTINNAKDCNKFLQQMSFPHLRFHPKSFQCKRDADAGICDTKLENGLEFKENKFSEKLKRESLHSQPSPEVVNSYRKRSLLEEDIHAEGQVFKRLRTESGSKRKEYVDQFPRPILMKREAKHERDLKYLPFQTIKGDQYIPFSGVDYSSLMDRIRGTEFTNMSPSFMKETESLLAAVQHSQMLYYTYCTKLLQNLQARKVLEEQERAKKTLSDYNTQSQRNDKHRKELEKRADQLKEGESSTRQNTVISEAASVKTNETISSTNTSSSVQIALRPSLTPSPSSPSQPSSTTAEEGPRTSTPSKDEQKPGKRRAPRALTGKHVRQGTGASLSTLQTLRHKLEERQRRRREQSIATDDGSASTGD